MMQHSWRQMLIVAAALSGIAAITLAVIDATSSSGDATASAPGADASVQYCEYGRTEAKCVPPKTCTWGRINDDVPVVCSNICLDKNSRPDSKRYSDCDFGHYVP